MGGLEALCRFGKNLGGTYLACLQHNRPASISVVDRKTPSKADDKIFTPDPAGYRRLALAALKTLTIPTETMIDAAHAVVWFDDAWTPATAVVSDGRFAP
jgi:hypothetical protein